MNVRARSSIARSRIARGDETDYDTALRGAFGRETELVTRVVLDLREPAHLDLPDALAGQVQDGAHLLQRDTAAICHVQRAGLGHFPDLQMREVELDGAGLRVDVQVQVVRAAHERARARHRRAFLAALRTLDVRRVDQQLGQPPLVTRQALGRDGLRTDAPIAPGRMHLATDARNFGLWNVVVFVVGIVEIVIHGAPPRRSLNHGQYRSLPPPAEEPPDAGSTC